MSRGRPPDQPFTEGSLPFLSHSRIAKYLHCPEQYRLYYEERLRPRVEAASLVFGQTLHEALALLFRTGADPVAFFSGGWRDLKNRELAYNQRESWEKLRETGQQLLERFMVHDSRRISDIQAAEKRFTLRITSLPVSLVGVIDLVANVDDKPSVVDFKTSASAYEEHEVVLSDQLTAYQLAEPQVQQTALCVLTKTKQPEIQWQFASRDGRQLAEYIRKTEIVTRALARREFYKRPGRWCAWCDYLPVCLGDQARIKETLVQLG